MFGATGNVKPRLRGAGVTDPGYRKDEDIRFIEFQR